jgi:ketosteroid isomerase-like protein
MSNDLVTRFYSNLEAGNGDAMADCYADNIVFEDPAFGELHGQDAGDMWRMLASRGTDLAVDFRIIEAGATAARVNWIATYTFSTGRHVRNDIMATMRIEDGKIVDHRDVFDLWKWSGQALGLPGKLLGWSPPMKAKVRSGALEGLAKFQKQQLS